MSNLIPKNQSIYINSSQAKIFNFNNISSHVYLGEAVNSLLRAFGNNLILSGFRIKSVNLINNELIVLISAGEAIVDHTMIIYNSDTELKINVSGLDDNGLIVPNINFKFIQTQQKNLSRIQLSYIDSSNICQTNNWFTDIPTLVLAIIEFNKSNQTAKKKIIPYFNRPKININGKEYTVYPTDQISNRMLGYIDEHLRL